MTFVETIYNELGQTHNINTADFSTDWLKQSKSYYTSLKTRNIDASNGALVNLLNKLDEEIASAGGKLYLAKDSRQSEKTFKHSYKKLEHWKKIKSSLIESF